MAALLVYRNICQLVKLAMQYRPIVHGVRGRESVNLPEKNVVPFEVIDIVIAAASAGT